MGDSDKQAEYTTRLRSRKSNALSDISNKVIAGIADATKRVGGRKRKLSNSSAEQDSKAKKEKKEETNDEDAVDLTDNPLNPEDNNNSTSADVSMLSDGALNESTDDRRASSSSKPNPNRIRRTFPLRMRSHDPSQCMGLLDDMYAIYYDHEDKYRSHPYMHKQDDLNNKMRSILIDWLVEVHHKFKLQTSTLYLCINLLDRYLSKVSILRGRLQLVGVTALFIACKFEEVYPPEVRDFVFITDNAYSREQVLRMETDILNELNYEILVPTPFHFLSRYLDCIRAGEHTRLVANYYAERNLQEPHMLDVKPREYAAAALYASLKQQSCQFSSLGDLEVWNRALREESNLEEADLVGCARKMVKHVSEEPQTTSKRKLIACKKKYSGEKFNNIAALPLPTI